MAALLRRVLCQAVSTGGFLTSDPLFRTNEGLPVPALTAEQMREVDRIAVEEFGLGILQMLTSISGELYVADIGIPPEVYQLLGFSFEPFFEDRFWISLQRQANSTPDR